jgi:hypothetical protein
MWIFLLVLALVPLAFYFSDSVIAVFPQLADYFPAKHANQPALSAKAHVGPDGKTEEPGRWYSTSTPKGYLAWTLSADGTYRLAAGCHKAGKPSLQVTNTEGKGLGDGLFLNFEYGMLQLGAGAYAGPDLVGSLAQFKTIYLQTRSRSVLAQFDVDGVESNSIARSLQAQCATLEVAE